MNHLHRQHDLTTFQIMYIGVQKKNFKNQVPKSANIIKKISMINKQFLRLKILILFIRSR